MEFCEFIIGLAKDQAKLEEFKKNPKKVMDEAGLEEDEKAACLMPDSDMKSKEARIRELMGRSVQQGILVVLSDGG